MLRNRQMDRRTEKVTNRGGCPPKKIKSKFHAFYGFPGLQNLDDFLENWVWRKFQNHFQPSVFGFSNSLPYSVEESRELRALIDWVLA